MTIDKEAIEHFKHKGRVIAATRVCEPLPRTLQEVNDQMKKISARSGKGTKDPMGGDLASHLAHIKCLKDWRSRQHDGD